MERIDIDELPIELGPARAAELRYQASKKALEAFGANL
jgi:hypothetical protein